MGRKSHKGLDEQLYRDLDRHYRLSGLSDPLCRAFNTLAADDRAIMLAYIACGKNKSTLCRLLGVSWPVLDDRLWRIQVVVKERYERIIKEQEL